MNWSTPSGHWFIVGRNGEPARYVLPVGVFQSLTPSPTMPRPFGLSGPPLDWPNPDTDEGDDDVLKVGVTAPKLTTARELSAKIKAMGGMVIVSPYSSEAIIATNNSLQFSVKRLADGSYQITDNGLTMYYLLGGGAFLLLLLFKD
ncbi:MAG TPA: hypothetical protein VGC87_23230 [Pyrinomonadaceae bacterium]|jgi:hypothetical protein